MVSLILFVIYMCKPTNKTLGIVTMIMLLIGTIFDFSLVGAWGFLDILFLIITIIVFSKNYKL